MRNALAEMVVEGIKTNIAAAPGDLQPLGVPPGRPRHPLPGAPPRPQVTALKVAVAVPFLELSLDLAGARPGGRGGRVLRRAARSSVTLADAGDDADPRTAARRGRRCGRDSRLPRCSDGRDRRRRCAASSRAPAERRPRASRPRSRRSRTGSGNANGCRTSTPMRFGTRLWICPGRQPPPARAGRCRSSSGSIRASPSAPARTPTTALCLSGSMRPSVARARVSSITAAAPASWRSPRSQLGAAPRGRRRHRPAGAARQPRERRAQRRRGAARRPVERRCRLGRRLRRRRREHPRRTPARSSRQGSPHATRAGARLVLSGLLAEQAAAVAAAYAPWFDIEPARMHAATGRRSPAGAGTEVRACLRSVPSAGRSSR